MKNNFEKTSIYLLIALSFIGAYFYLYSTYNGGTQKVHQRSNVPFMENAIHQEKQTLPDVIITGEENTALESDRDQDVNEGRINLGSFTLNSNEDRRNLYLSVSKKYPDLSFGGSTSYSAKGIVIEFISETKLSSTLVNDIMAFFEEIAQNHNSVYVSPVPVSSSCDTESSGCTPPAQKKAVVYTKHVQSVYEDSAIIWSETKINDSKSADVYFIWGTSESEMVDAVTKKSLSEIDALGDFVKKKYADIVYSDKYLNVKLSELESSRKYYYSACIENTQGLFACDQTINTFETLHKKDKNYVPQIRTGNSYYNDTGLNLYSPILTGSFGNDAPYPGYIVRASFVMAEKESSLKDTSRLFGRNKMNDVKWVGVVESQKDFKKDDFFEEMAHSQRETSFYYRACAHYDVAASGTTYASDTFVCGDIKYNQAKINFFN